MNLRNGNQNKIHKYKRRLHLVTAVLCYSQNKNPNPSPISEKFGFDWFGDQSGSRTPDTLIKKHCFDSYIHIRALKNLREIMEGGKDE